MWDYGSLWVGCECGGCGIMGIFSQIIGVLMILGFKMKFVNDGLKTEAGAFIVAIVYILCACALIVLPVVFRGGIK